MHTCHAIACRLYTPPRMLFCARHWRMTPPANRVAVWNTYREGQEIDKDPSPAYLIAHHEAVIAVAEAEGLGEHPDCIRERRALARAREEDMATLTDRTPRTPYPWE